MISEISLDEANKIFYKSFFNQPFSLSPSYCYIDSLREKDLFPVFLLCSENKNIILFSFHKKKMINSLFYQALSPYGYGQPLSNTKDKKFIFKSLKNYFIWLKKNNITLINFKPHPFIFRKNRNNLKIKKKVISIKIKKNWYSELSARCRTSIRKAQKNNLYFRILSYEYIDQFKEMYFSTLDHLKAKEFYYFNSEYFKEILKNKNVKLFGVFQKEKLISSCIILKNNKVSEYHLSANTELGYKFAAANLMIANIIEYLRREGSYNFYLGGGTTEDEKDSLLIFKKSFGGDYLSYRPRTIIINERFYNKFRSLYDVK